MTIYVCPMHPSEVADHPGSCQRCGMNLEPETVSATPEATSGDPDASAAAEPNQ